MNSQQIQAIRTYLEENYSGVQFKKSERSEKINAEVTVWEYVVDFDKDIYAEVIVCFRDGRVWMIEILPEEISEFGAKTVEYSEEIARLETKLFSLENAETTYEIENHMTGEIIGAKSIKDLVTFVKKWSNEGTPVSHIFYKNMSIKSSKYLRQVANGEKMTTCDCCKNDVKAKNLVNFGDEHNTFYVECKKCEIDSRQAN